jgi:O-antigen ligase
MSVPALVFFVPAVFVIEVILGGPFGIYGGVRVRLLLLALSVAILVFALLVRGRVERSHLPTILGIAGFLICNGIWVAIVPVLAGTNMHWALREPHAFAVLSLVVLVLAVLQRGQLARLVPRLQRVVVVTSLILASFQVALWVLGTVLGDLKWVVPFTLSLVFPGGGDQIYVGQMPDGFFRVFWISSLWCVLSFFWVPIAFPESRLNWLFRGLLLLDIFAAYSRGIWLGVVVGQAVVLVTTLSPGRVGKIRARSVLIGALAIAALIGVLAVTGTLNRGAGRFTSTTSRADPSISARIAQAPHLLRLWYEDPVLGKGYGAYAPEHLRSQEAPYSYENMPYALLAKLGLLGVLVSAAFVAGWALTAWVARSRAPVPAGSFLGSGTALLIAEMTNPMVLNFVSMTILACLLLQWANLVSPPEQTRERITSFRELTA